KFLAANFSPSRKLRRDLARASGQNTNRDFGSFWIGTRLWNSKVIGTLRNKMRWRGYVADSAEVSALVAIRPRIAFLKRFRSYTGLEDRSPRPQYRCLRELPVSGAVPISLTAFCIVGMN